MYCEYKMYYLTLKLYHIKLYMSTENINLNYNNFDANTWLKNTKKAALRARVNK